MKYGVETCGQCAKPVLVTPKGGVFRKHKEAQRMTDYSHPNPCRGSGKTPDESWSLTL